MLGRFSTFPTLHLFKVCVGFRIKVSLRDTHQSRYYASYTYHEYV